MSNDVVAEIHDPAQHPVSIGLTFNGGGANGADCNESYRYSWRPVASSLEQYNK